MEEGESKSMATTHSSEKVLNNQTAEELIEIDENGVVHAVGYTSTDLKSTILRDPEGEYAWLKSVPVS